MSARLFGAALGLGTGGKRSPRSSDPSGGHAVAPARMVTPRLRIVRPAGKTEGDSKGRAGPVASKLIVRREGSAGAPGGERSSEQEPGGSAPSRLKVTRPPSTAQDDSDAAIAASASREPRSESEPGEVPERSTAPTARIRREQPSVRERPAVESGQDAAARAQSVGLFSLAKMRSSSGPRKVRGRGETTTREQRLGVADHEPSSPTMSQPQTRTLQVRRLQVRREPAVAPSDNELATLEVRASAKRSADSEQLGRNLSPSSVDGASPTAKKPRSIDVPDRSTAKESRKRLQSADDLESASSASNLAADDDPGPVSIAKPDDKPRSGRDGVRYSPPNSPTGGTDEASSNRQRAKRHRRNDLDIEADGPEDAPLFSTEVPLFPTGSSEEAVLAAADRPRKNSSTDKRALLDRALDSKMRSRLTLRTERAHEAEADGTARRRESRDSDRDRRQLDRELEEIKAGTTEMDSDRKSRREAESQSHRWRSSERSRWPGEDDTRRSSGSPTDDRWMPHGDLDDYHRRSESSHRSSREHESRSTSSRNRRSDRHTSPSRDETRRPSASERHSDRDHVSQTSRGSRSHRRSRSRSRSSSRSRRSHRKSSKDDPNKSRKSSSSRKKRSRERADSKDAERRASSSPVDKHRDEPPEEVVFGCSERPEQSGDEDDVLAQIHGGSSPRHLRSPSEDANVPESAEPSKSPRTSPVRTSPVRTSPVRTSPVHLEKSHKRDLERDHESERVVTETQRHERRGADSASWRGGQYEIVEESNLRVILPKDLPTGGVGDEDEEEQNDQAIEDDRPICKFFASARGCLRGDRCWFQHVLPSKTPRDKDGAGIKTDGQRQVEKLDKELDELPATASNATALASGNGAASAAASNVRPTSSPSPNGSPRWAEYSDWQGYDYYDSNESCGIVGSMVLNAVSSSDEEDVDPDENEVAKGTQRVKPKSTSYVPATQSAQTTTSPKETQCTTTANNDSSAVGAAANAGEEASPVPPLDVDKNDSAAVAASASAANGASPAPSLNVDQMRVPELRKALAAKGLASTGKRAELVLRLRGADA